MNRRQKIIISVIGIFIILLALVGITYGYFLTRIQGNTNTTSITVTTANLSLIYNDGTPAILTSANPIMPDSNNPVGTKVFTVTNDGNATIEDYGVVIEDFSVVYATSGTTIDGTTYNEGDVTSFKYPNDLKLVITCESNDGSTCNGYDSTLPTTNNVLLTNTIDEDEVHTYTAILTYIDSGIDQSLDMNKTINGKFNIIDTKATIDIEGTVAYYSAGDYVQINSEPKISQIDSNGKYKVVGVAPDEHTIEVYSSTNTKKGTTNLSITKGNEEKVDTTNSTVTITDESRTVIVDINSDYELNIMFKPYKDGTLANAIFTNSKITKNTTTPTFTGVATEEEGLYQAPDDYGTSWYFRGAQSNNYVNFAGFAWRIVRINGDGSVRLILDGTLDSVDACNDTTICATSEFNTSYNDNAYVGYMYGFTGGVTNKCITKDTTTGKYTVDSSVTYTSKETCETAGGRWASSEYDSTHINVNDSTIKTQLDSFYEKYLNSYSDYISDTIFCGDKSLASSTIGSSNTALGYGKNKTYYVASERLYFSTGTNASAEATPTLECAKGATNTYSRYTVSEQTINGVNTNGDLKYSIALLSADELVMAGAFNRTANKSYYLYDAYKNGTSYNYWWTTSPSDFSDSGIYELISLGAGNSLTGYNVSRAIGSRPVINLKSDVLVSGGDGTSGDGAYTVKLGG